MNPRIDENRLGAVAWAPDDLRGDFGEKPLLRAVLESVDETLHDRGRATELNPGTAGLPPAMLLSVLTYAYACGMESSIDVELGCLRDPVLLYICAGNFPDFDALRNFRRWHRALIQVCLARTFDRLNLACSRPARGPSSGRRMSLHDPHGGRCRNLDHAVPPSGDTEACRRLRRAIQADSMTLDV